MYPDIPSGFGKLTIFYLSPGGTGHGQIGFDFKQPSAGYQDQDTTTDPPTGTIYTILNLVNTFMTNVMQTTYEVSGIEVIINRLGVLTEELVASGAAGLGTAGNVPVETAVLLQKRTAGLGKANRGRVYLPPPSPDGLASTCDRLNTDAVNAHQTTADTFFAGMDSADLPLYLLHKPTKASPLVYPDPTPLTSLVVHAVLADQRGRVRKRTHH